MFNNAHPTYKPTSHPTVSSQPYLAPSSSSGGASPSAFSRSSGIRGQLHKIPSALFTKPANTAHPAANQSVKTVDHHRPFLASLSPRRVLRRDKENHQTSDPQKAKQGKARKGLAELFHWGNHGTHTPPAQPVRPQSPKVISAPIALAHPTAASPPAPAPPPKNTIMPALKKRPSNLLTKKPSQAIINATPALQVPQSTPQSRARPSMGEDPFSRRGSGAEVVDTVSRDTLGSSIRSSARSSTRSERSDVTNKRESNASSRAMSGTTLMEDPNEGAFEVALQSAGLASPVRLFPIPDMIPERAVAVPGPAIVLIDAPVRSASLGRALEASVSRPAKDQPSPTLAAPSSFLAVDKTMKKERTRSRVWGIFGRKQAKAEGNMNKLAQSISSPQPRNAFDGSSLSSRQGTVTSARSHTSGFQDKDPHTAASSLFERRPIDTHRQPRLPILHVQKPSTDITTSDTANVRQISYAPMRSSIAQTSTVGHRAGTYESVDGCTPERPSVKGPPANIHAVIPSKGLPKRKSLTGVFGLAFKKSFDKLKPQTSRSSLRSGNGTMRAPPSSFNGGTMRALAEEMETAEKVQVRIGKPSVPYHSRFGDAHLHQPMLMLEKDKKSQGGLQRVASATDKLSSLVSIDFSPAPDTPSDGGSLAAPPSLASVDASPTPVRRVHSAVLTKKKSAASSLKAGSSISPLKLALHQAQAGRTKKQTPKSGRTGASPFDAVNTSAASMVRKGMRNIFSPPTPPRAATPRKATATKSRVNEVLVPPQYCKDFDVPDDLKAIIGLQEGANKQPLPPYKANIGLPSIPPLERKLPGRNNAFPAPKHSLPPVPDIPSEYRQGSRNDRISPFPPRLTLNLVDEDGVRSLIFSDMLSVGKEHEVNEYRNSFDFTRAYASLDTSSQRASLVEALASAQISLPIGPISRLSGLSEDSNSSCDRVSRMLREAEANGELGDDQDDEDAEDDLEVEIATVIVQRTPRLSRATSVKTPRRSPFQGQPAFQVAAVQFKNTPPRQVESHSNQAVPQKPAFQPFSFISQPAAVEGPANTRQGWRRANRMNEAGMSIASMSSIGSVIETRIANDFTNYFDLDFASHLEGESHGDLHSRKTSVDSNGSRPSRDRTRNGRHHRRNSSILSVESVGEDHANLAHNLAMGPPVSMRNRRRSGYISRHRHSDSNESVSVGRSDWAAHRRNSSIASTLSNLSLSRLGRPGLGDRMFQLDGGVQLTSITGSPADHLASSKPSPDGRRRHQRNDSYDSFFEHETSRAIYDSILDSSGTNLRDDSLFASTTSRKDDSLFETSKMVDHEAILGASSPFTGEADRMFLLKGLSSAADYSGSVMPSPSVKDANGYNASPLPRGPVRSYEAQGEDDSIHLDVDQSMTGRQMLNASIKRPAKPRRHPANRVFQPETPALSSPSTTATSSRLSLDTRFSSDAESIYHVRGHQRQKSSAHVRCEATIREEPSMATLRGVGVRPHVDASAIRAREVQAEEADEETPETVRYWNQWKREADDEYKRMKAYGNSFKMDDEDTLIRNNNDLANFLAESAALYKPLDQLPIGRRLSHRCKKSLSDARQLTSPYSLPLPQIPSPGIPLLSGGRPQIKRLSLETKFERKQRSSTSSHLTIEEARIPTTETAIPSPSSGASGVFAQFISTRETAPTIAKSPLGPAAFSSESFGRSNSDSAAMINAAKRNSAMAAPDRSRVNSDDRRAALGWRRRRNSDDPTKVEQMAWEYEASRSHFSRTMAGLPEDLQQVVASQVIATTASRKVRPVMPPTSSRPAVLATVEPSAAAKLPFLSAPSSAEMTNGANAKSDGKTRGPSSR